MDSKNAEFSENHLAPINVNEKRGMLQKNLSYEKAVTPTTNFTAAPHHAEQSEKWVHDYRKDLFPNKADWTVQALNGTHIWLETEVSGCYFSSSSLDCKKSGPRKKCGACKIVAHEKCIQQVDTLPKCRMTFREGSLKGGDINPQHHLVSRRKQDGKCDVCGKGFQSMLSYKSQKENIALNCTWCKRAFHTKDCSLQFMKEQCDLGTHKNVILPPSWIVKLPSRKYSTVTNKRGRHQQSTRRQSSRERRAFVVKPMDGDHKVPIIIFANPRSGGNQGFRILEKYQYILNPRQVFDLSCGGPRFGLDLYRKVPNLRILVCGGDGSVGWVLSEIDHLKMNHPPLVSILPLGTGNDLARFLGWGGGYADEPLSKILTHVEEGEVQRLDRWEIDVRPHSPQTSVENDQGEEKGQSKLPLNVMNNYFSMGADADVTLQFHESREANPEKFNSRVKNKYFYTRIGGEAIVKRKYIDLYKCIESFVCDGTDLTARIRELKPSSIVFLNIPLYASGTSPWGNPSSENYLPQSCDDGYLEIVGLTSKSLVATQVGGHGTRIFQCQTALVYTNTKIAMQVDGEPCRLNSSRLFIRKKNQAIMVVKKKPHSILYHQKTLECESTSLVSTPLFYMNFLQYNCLVNYDLTEIKSVAQEIVSIQLDTDMQLDDMRKKINAMKASEQFCSSKLGEDWCFLDAKWKSRIYRIDDAQESLMHVSDIIEDGIYILDLKKETLLVPPTSINLSKSQPTSPQIQRRAKSSATSGMKETPCRMTKSLDFSYVPPISRNSDNDSIASESDCESDMSDFSEYDELNSLSSSPGVMTPPLTPVSRIYSGMDFVISSSENEREKQLFEAAKRGLVDRFEELYRSGTSLTINDQSGRTPLHIAAKYGRKNIINFIVSNISQIGINVADKENLHTPLHLAAMHKRRTICRTLIAHGALVTCFDRDGLSPRLLALNSQDGDLAKYLQSQERLQLIAADDHETAV